MSLFSRLKSLCFGRAAKDDPDQLLLTYIAERKPRRLLEVGVGRAARGIKLIRAMQAAAGNAAVNYVGLDLFEMSPTLGEHTTLIEAYKCLRATSARVQLLPGDPLATLCEAANQLGKFDLILFADDCELSQTSRLWFYLPRLLHAPSEVFVRQNETSEDDAPRWQPLSSDHIRRAAEAASRTRRAA